jgi:hypothetical protein
MLAVNRSHRRACSSPASRGNLSHVISIMAAHAIPARVQISNEFNADFGLTTDRGETFGLSVFLRDGHNVFRT